MALKMFSSPRCDTAYDVQFILQIAFFFFLSVTYFNCCYYSLQLLISSKNFFYEVFQREFIDLIFFDSLVIRSVRPRNFA